ncbi:hypothetical protein GGQ66_004533 [Rhizobium borbori]|uniref:Mutator family transposase n=1 Tax=Allorhizobium borbori TaxID=485907 RepID=A0A7W6K675_9HYPH|nr:hypothetical protein [Allorhizobium borbori]
MITAQFAPAALGRPAWNAGRHWRRKETPQAAADISKAFLSRPIEGDWPYLWIDATYLNVRRGGRIVSVAVIIAIGVNTDGRREVLALLWQIDYLGLPCAEFR